MSVTDKGTGHKARRIPIDGIPQGNQTDDLETVAVKIKKDEGKPTEHVESTRPRSTRASRRPAARRSS